MFQLVQSTGSIVNGKMKAKQTVITQKGKTRKGFEIITEKVGRKRPHTKKRMLTAKQINRLLRY
jgi:hypothetical protein